MPANNGTLGVSPGAYAGILIGSLIGVLVITLAFSILGKRWGLWDLTSRGD